MKKFINKALLSLAVLSVATACDDNLDILPEQSLSPGVATGTPDNVKRILVGNYANVRSTDSYAGGIGLASELLANDGDLQWNGTYVQPAEYNEKAMVSSNSFVRDIWLNAYEINNLANIVLDNLDIFTDPVERDQVEGEARFQRALAYFDLARLFSAPYSASQATSQLAVPIILDPVLDGGNITYPARNSLDEVYGQVIDDLTTAYGLLPDDNGYFADKYAAMALLARVYLQMGNHTEAAAAAHDVIENSGASLTASFGGAFNNPENSSEDIFALQVTSQDSGGHDFNLFWAGEDYGGRNGNPDVSVNEEHFAIYDDPDDARLAFFYEEDGWATTKWQNQYGNIPVIRLAEMYLIRAEANQRLTTALGQSPLEDINVLRLRANADPFATVDLETILAERKRELAFEGFALFDVKRLGLNVGALPFDSEKLVLPIPLRELDANPELVPNPGY